MLKTGEVQGKSKLDQIIEHLMLQEADYLWWNDEEKLSIHVPEALGGTASFQSMAEPETKEKRSKTTDPRGQ